MNMMPSSNGRPHDPGGSFQLNLNPNYQYQFAIGLQYASPEAKALLNIAKMLLEYVMAIFSLPLDLVLRKNWGTREITLFKVVSMFGWIVYSTILLRSSWVSNFIMLVAFVGLWRFIEANLWEWRCSRNVDLKNRYSYHGGDPYAWEWIANQLYRVTKWKGIVGIFTDTSVFLVFEPATALVGIPLLYLPVTYNLGVVILVSGVALFMKRIVLHRRFVNVTRDRIDAKIVGQMMTEEADNFRRDIADGEAFLVELAVPRKLKTETTAAGLPTLPLGSPSARVIEDDGTGRPIVACPECSSRLRCPLNYASRSLNCPECATEFVVE